MKDKRLKIVVVAAIAVLLLIAVAVVFKAGQGISNKNGVREPNAQEVDVSPAEQALAWNERSQGRFAAAAIVDAQGREWVATEHEGVWVHETGAEEGWKNFTVEDGLGENNVCALAVDGQGRVWAGHLKSGVSVYNGKEWKHYGQTDGPLGGHVYDIGVCPASAHNGAGDVWIVTELGLTRYSPATDSWTYTIRNNVIPHDRASRIAFDSNGDLFLALQNEGVAYSLAGGNYQEWPRTYGPDRTPTKGSGEGLPSRLINDVLVMRDDTVFAATASGLARSVDHGKSWTFVRGVDWDVKARKSIGGAPKGFSAGEKGVLSEDFVTCLAEDEAGLLWVGFRTKGYQCLDPKTMKSLYEGGTNGADYCTAIAPRSGQAPLLATRGNGLRQAGRFFAAKETKGTATTKAVADVAPLPSKAKAPTADEVRKLIGDVKALGELDAKPVATYLGEDWSTQGNWVGRYGREEAYWPNYGALAKRPGFAVKAHAGTHARGHGNVYHYRSGGYEKEVNVLYYPKSGKREQWEWNDGGWQEETYGANWEGPDLWLDVTVPAGNHLASVYLFNNDGDGRLQRRRDYPIELKAYTESIAEVEKAPALARARFGSARSGVYKTFLLSEGRYWIRVGSQYSNTVKVMAVFFDRAGAAAEGDVDATSTYLGGATVDRPEMPAASASESEQVKAARELWAALDGAYGRARVADVQLPYRVFAYRAAAAGAADEKLLASWRWSLHWWTEDDQADWETAMEAARGN